MNECNIRELPEFIRNSSNIHTLVLNGNTLRAIPDWFSELKKLKVLKLKNNLFEKIPEIIHYLPSLEEVDFELTETFEP